jgi:hypothetical protein
MCRGNALLLHLLQLQQRLMDSSSMLCLLQLAAERMFRTRLMPWLPSTLTGSRCTMWLTSQSECKRHPATGSTSHEQQGADSHVLSMHVLTDRARV